MQKIVKYFLDNRLVAFLLLTLFIAWGIAVAPFGWHLGGMPRDPVLVDAIPDIGENQQIVATEWMGRSPQDIENQITYPLTTALMGLPNVKTIRSTSMFGMSFIYIIFNDKVDFYWSRSRILEKLNSLPSGTLPAGVQPTLGPDATGLGQIYWYTLEGRDPKTGKPTGGWSPEELRTIQDFTLKYALASAEGVSEVASVGGFVKEYQVDINPDAMKSYGVTVMDIMNAVRRSNLDIGAETIEMNKVEYMIRGIGYLKSLEDLRESVVAVRNNVPVRISDIANVSFGPAPRRGGLDKEGSEAVGAVVVARYGSNPLEVINNVKQKIAQTASGLPEKKLADGTISKVTIVPFYDRTGLIKETIGTLEFALKHEILICIIVIIVLVFNLRASVIISSLLPVAVLMTFIIMKYSGVNANIVALSGIAIAIGVMVDIGIVLTENIIRHLELPENNGIRGKQLIQIIFEAATEVLPAMVTAMATTIVSFLPVFFLEASEGKMFRPLAFTKTFALGSSLLLGIIILPALSYFIFSIRFDGKKVRNIWNELLIIAGIALLILKGSWPALALSAIGVNNLFARRWPEKRKHFPEWITIGITLAFALYYLAIEWLPLGAHHSSLTNFIFVGTVVSIILTILLFMVHYYEPALRWCLTHKTSFLLLPLFTVMAGILIWLGWSKSFGLVASGLEKLNLQPRETAFWRAADKSFPGVGKEFMPALNEGSFLLMPSSMPHTGVQQNLDYIGLMDRRLKTIPEIEQVVGKWGRVNSALDPANIQMFENVINYKPEYILDENGHRMRFKTNGDGSFILRDGTTYNIDRDGFRKISGSILIPDRHGDYFRQWRPEIRNPDDIWKEIIKMAQLPGVTPAPKLQPIETRLVMLSTGMRAPMGIKVYGPDIETIEKASIGLEGILKEVPSIESSSVYAERSVGAPYLLINMDRKALARYGITMEEVQDMIQVAIGGMELTRTVEGRERFGVRVRYARELRSSPDELKNILIPTMTGVQIPLGEIATIRYQRGPQMIRSENTFLTSYVTFDQKPGFAEVDVVNQAGKFIQQKIDNHEWQVPAGVTYSFAGNYEQQVRATKRLLILIPLSLLAIFLILFFRFRTVTASMIHFSGVFVAFAGGFIMLWLYGQHWFMNFSLAGVNMRDLFQMHTINLSVAVWVGFIALFGIATNDGVIMGTYIHQMFEQKKPVTVSEVREAVVLAGKKRVRPAMMTTAVTIIALLPVLTSTGKGAEIMVPMAIPTFGGMVIQIMTMYVVPVLQAMWREHAVAKVTHRSQESLQDNENI